MSSSIKYRAEIDGLRAIAVISVIIYHLNALATGWFSWRRYFLCYFRLSHYRHHH